MNHHQHIGRCNECDERGYARGVRDERERIREMAEQMCALLGHPDEGRHLHALAVMLRSTPDDGNGEKNG